MPDPESEPKPCPFCGRPPVVQQRDGDWTVACPSGAYWIDDGLCAVAPVLVDRSGRTRGEAVRVWNERKGA